MENIVQLVKLQLHSLIGNKCYGVLVEDLTFTDLPCLRLALSKALGSGIVVGASLVKLPQILKIIGSGSGAGVSLLSVALETCAFIVSLAYNVRLDTPFSTYGEMMFIIIQNLLLFLLIASYRNAVVQLMLTLSAMALLAYTTLVPNVMSFDTLTLLQTLTIPLSIASKLPQIWTNFRNKNTGQLSIITVALFFFGSAARVFTTHQEVNDNVLLGGCVIAALLNAILLVQMFQYWNGPKPKSKKA